MCTLFYAYITEDEIVMTKAEYYNFKNLTLFYSGYLGSIRYCDKTSLFYGKILDIDEEILYNSKTEAGLQEAFESAFDCYINKI